MVLSNLRLKARIQATMKKNETTIRIERPVAALYSMLSSPSLKVIAPSLTPSGLRESAITIETTKLIVIKTKINSGTRARSVNFVFLMRAALPT